MEAPLISNTGILYFGIAVTFVIVSAHFWAWRSKRNN